MVNEKLYLIFIAPLLWIFFSHEKKSFFSSHHYIYYTMISLLHLTSIYCAHYPTNLSKMSQNDILPTKHVKSQTSVELQDLFPKCSA